MMAFNSFNNLLKTNVDNNQNVNGKLVVCAVSPNQVTITRSTRLIPTIARYVHVLVIFFVSRDGTSCLQGCPRVIVAYPP